MAQNSHTVLFQGCRLIDGLSPEALLDVDVLVENERISRIEPGPSSIAAERDWTIVPCQGHTLLPGLIDCHVHFNLDLTESGTIAGLLKEPEGITLLRASRNARIALERGVTTVRALGGRDRLDLILRDAIKKGLIEGPRILAANRPITITGGHMHEVGREADSIDELRKAAREQLEVGADVLKITTSGPALWSTGKVGSEMSEAEVQAVAKEAHRVGKRLASHAHVDDAVIASARGGVDSVEHAMLASADAIRVLKECGTFLVPTLTVLTCTAESPNAPANYRARAREVLPKHYASCENAIALGVRVAAGTDCLAATEVAAGLVAKEVRLLHERGLKPMEAIQAATRNAAELLGVDSQIGTVSPGKLADLILVPGDPLHDLTCLESPSVVMKEGRIAFQRMS